MKAAFAFAALALSVSAASAEVVIERAEYAGGVTEIIGETSRSFQTVTIDGRYSTVSDASGSFQVWLRYLPIDCVINIKVQDEVHPAFVNGCAIE